MCVGVGVCGGVCVGVCACVEGREKCNALDIMSTMSIEYYV